MPGPVCCWQRPTKDRVTRYRRQRCCIVLIQYGHRITVSQPRLLVNISPAGKEQSGKALAHFHGTAQTRPQELEMAVVVYFAGQSFSQRRQWLKRTTSTIHQSIRLLLLANTLQFQGRYPDVNRMLGSKRGLYAGSPEFLVTLAESESDASIYPGGARRPATRDHSEPQDRIKRITCLATCCPG